MNTNQDNGLVRKIALAATRLRRAVNTYRLFVCRGPCKILCAGQIPRHCVPSLYRDSICDPRNWGNTTRSLVPLFRSNLSSLCGRGSDNQHCNQ
jgi:hypothetical protein